MQRQKKFKALVKAIAVFTIASFVSRDAVLAQDSVLAWKAPTHSLLPERPSNSRSPQISDQLGVKRSEHLDGDADELIVNIQDAHASIGSQKTMAKILAELVGQFHLDLIGIEGTSGSIDTGLVASFPDQKVRESVAESLLRDTRIGGAEFFKIISRNDVELVGVEDASLYKSNIRSYQRLILDSNRIRVALTDLKSVLVKLEAKIYSDRIRTFNTKRLLHESGDLKFVDYWTFLKGLVAEAGLNADNRPNLSVLIRTAELESGLDFDQAGKQRDQLVAELKKKLNGNDLEALSQKAIQFKSGELSQGKFNAELIDRAREAGIDPVAYKDFILFTEYVELYEGIDFLRVFEEISGLESDLQAALLQKPEERALAALNHTVEIFGKLIEVKLSSADERYFREHRDEFRIPQIRAAVEALAAPQGVDTSAVNWRLLGSKIPDSDKFYQLAKERNETMLANLIARMRAHGKKAAAIVTGGFHTEGISELMRERRVSHVVYMPKFDGKEGERPYYTVITQKGSFMDASVRRDAQLEAMALVLASAVKGGMKFEKARDLWVDSYAKDLAANGTKLNESDLTDTALTAALDRAEGAIKFAVTFDRQGVPHASSTRISIDEFKRTRDLSQLTSGAAFDFEAVKPAQPTSAKVISGPASPAKGTDPQTTEASSAAPGSALAIADPAALAAGARMALFYRRGPEEQEITVPSWSLDRRSFLRAVVAAAGSAALPNAGRRVSAAEPFKPAPVPMDYANYSLKAITAELNRLDAEIKHGSVGLAERIAGGKYLLISDLESVFRFRDLPKDQQDMVRERTESEPEPDALFLRKTRPSAAPQKEDFYSVRLTYKGFNMLARAINKGTAYAHLSAADRDRLLSFVRYNETVLKEHVDQNVENWQKARDRWLELKKTKAEAWVKAHQKDIEAFAARSKGKVDPLQRAIQGWYTEKKYAESVLASTPAMIGQHLPPQMRLSWTHYGLNRTQETNHKSLPMSGMPQTLEVMLPRSYSPEDTVTITADMARSMLRAGKAFITKGGDVYTPLSDWRANTPRQILENQPIEPSDHGYAQNHFGAMTIGHDYGIMNQWSVGGVDDDGKTLYTERDEPDHYRSIAEGEIPGQTLLPRFMAVESDSETGEIVKRYTDPSEMQGVIIKSLPVFRIYDNELWEKLKAFTTEQKEFLVKNWYPALPPEEVKKRASIYLRTVENEFGRFCYWAPFMSLDEVELRKGPNQGKTRYQLVGMYAPPAEGSTKRLGNKISFGSTPAVLQGQLKLTQTMLIPYGGLWPKFELAIQTFAQFPQLTKEQEMILNNGMLQLAIRGGAWRNNPLERQLLPFSGPEARVEAERLYAVGKRDMYEWIATHKDEIAGYPAWRQEQIHAVINSVEEQGMIANTQILEGLSTLPLEFKATGAIPAREAAFDQLAAAVPGVKSEDGRWLLTDEEITDILEILRQSAKPAENEGAKKGAPAAAPVLAQGARMSARVPLEKTTNPIDIAYVASESGFKGQPKVGGQFDVMEGLPLAMAKRGHNVTVISPQFKDIDPSKITESITIEVPYGRGPDGKSGKMKMTVNKVVFEKEGAKITYLFLKDPDNVFFKTIYNNADGAEGYFEAQILPRAAIELILQGYVKPNALHLNDWQTALAAAYIRRTDIKDRPELKKLKLLYSSHNMAYQGAFNGYFEVGGDFRDGELGKKLIRDGAIDPFKDLEQRVHTGHFAGGSQHILHLVNDGDPNDNLLGLPVELIVDPHRGIEFNRGHDVGGQAPVATGWKVALGKSFRYADKLVGVSEGNMHELQQAPSDGGKAFGMEGLVREMADAGKVAAVFNGGAGMPSEDPALRPGNEHNYSSDVVGSRPQNKRALFHELAKLGEASYLALQDGREAKIQFHGNLPSEADWANEFIIGGVARITEQKGFNDITEELMWRLRNMRLPDGRKPRLVILGKAIDSDPAGIETQKRLIGLANQFPDVFTMLVGYDEALSKHIFASIDVFMMNSYFEPAGITQQIANEYGAPVIAPLTGGLHDFFHKWNGQGFAYKAHHPWVSDWDRLHSMYDTIQYAFDVYTQHPDEWNKKVALAAQYDGSWDSRVMAYEHNVYLSGLAESSAEHPDFHYQVNSLADLDRLPVYEPNLPSRFDLPAGDRLRTLIPQTTGNYFEFKDPATDEGRELIARFVEYLSAPLTPDLLLEQKLVSTLNHVRDAWDRWPVDSIKSIYHQVIQNSIKDIAQFKDMRRVEAARRRLYNIAFMEYHNAYYQRRPSLDRPRNLDNPRWLEIHDDLIYSMREALRPGGIVAPQGRQLLESLIEIDSNKHTLDQYAVHRQHTPQRDFESTLAHGLDVAQIPPGSERTDKIYFSDGHVLDKIFGATADREGQPDLSLRVRIDAGTETGKAYLVEERTVGAEIGDDDGDFKVYGKVPVDAIEVVHPLYPWIGIPLSLFKSYDDLKKFYESLSVQRLPQAGARLAQEAASGSEEAMTALELPKESFVELIKQFLSVRLNRWLTGIGVSLPFVSAGASLLMGGGVPLLPMALLGVVFAAPILTVVFLIWRSEHNIQRADRLMDATAAELFNQRWSGTILIGVDAAEDRGSIMRHATAAMRAPLNVAVVPQAEFRDAMVTLNPKQSLLIERDLQGGRTTDAEVIAKITRLNDEYAADLAQLFQRLQSADSRTGLALSNLPEVGPMDHYVSMLLAAAPERRSEIVLSDSAAAGLQSGKLQPMTITLDALLLQDPTARKLESRQYSQLGVTRTVVYPETYNAEALGQLQRELPEMIFKSVPNEKYASGDFMDEVYSDLGRMSDDQRSHMVIVSAEDQKVVSPGVKRLEVSRNGADGNGAAFVTKAAIEVALSTGAETAADLASLGIKVLTAPGRETIYRYERKMEPFLAAYIQRVLHSITQTSTAA